MLEDGPRFELIRRGPLTTAAIDVKTPSRGFVIRTLSRHEERQQSIWKERSAHELADSLRKALALVRRQEFGLDEYIPATKIQEVDEDTVNIVQRQIIGLKLQDYIRQLAEEQGSRKVELPAEILRQLNDILLKSLKMAIETIDFPRGDLPLDLVKERYPAEGEGVILEVIGGGAMDNIMIGVPWSQRNDPDAEQQLWITDCADVFIVTEDMAKDMADTELYFGYSFGSVYDQLDREVINTAYELDRRVLEKV